jgi:hypothetical protein
MTHRPWGPIDWTLSLSSPKPWHFVGAIGTEERSLCGWTYLRAGGAIASELLIEVQDVDSEKYRERTRDAITERHALFAQNGGDVGSIRSIELMTEGFRIAELANIAEAAGPAVILDITSLPKRFFFPILRTLIKSARVRDLVVTYTSPATYAEGDLYEEPEPWRVLPFQTRQFREGFGFIQWMHRLAREVLG